MVKEDIAKTTVIVDSKQSINELGRIEMEVSELRQKLKLLRKASLEYSKTAEKMKALELAGKKHTKAYENTRKKLEGLKASQKQYVQTSKKLDAATAKVEALRKKLGLSAMTMKQMKSHARSLQTQLERTSRGTAQYKSLLKQLKAVNRQISIQRNQVRGLSGFWRSFGQELQRFGVLALTYLGVQEIVGRIESLVSGSAKLSDAFSDVEKNAEMTREEVEALDKALKKINTRTTRRELLELASIAGKQGLRGQKDILEFVKGMDKIVVSLKEDLGDTKTVVKEIAKITQTFKVQTKEGVSLEKALIKVGSSINKLGASSNANEGFLVSFTKRMGGISGLTNTAIQDILGLGATLDQLGQTEEVSSTALSKLFIKMAEDVETYAGFAGMEVEAFKELLEKDLIGAFIKILEHTGKTTTGLTSLAATLDTLGLDGGRVVGVFGSLANNTKLLRQQQKIANESFKEGTSILEEFNKKNNNLAAKLEKVKKYFHGKFVNSSFLKGLEKMVSGFAEWIKIPVSQTLKEEKKELNTLVRAIKNTNEGTDLRRRLIDELQKKYPGFMKNLDAEKLTNQQLEERLQGVNKAYLQKIVLQQHEEKINELIRERNQLYDQQKEAEKKLAEAQQQRISVSKKIQSGEISSTDSQFTNDEGGPTKAQYASTIAAQLERVRRGETIDLQQKVNELLQQVAEEKAKQKDFLDTVTEEFKDFFGGTETETNTNDNKGGGGGLGSPEINEKAFDELLKRWQQLREDIRKAENDFTLSQKEQDEQELSRIDQKYLDLRNRAIDAAEESKILKQSLNFQLAEIDELYHQEKEAKEQEFADRDKELRQQLREEIEQLNISEQEQELEQVEVYYEELEDRLEKLHMTEIDLTESKQKAIDAINKKYREKEEKDTNASFKAKLQSQSRFLGEFSNLISATNELIAFSGAAGLEHSKGLTLAQIAIDTAAALSAIVPLAVEASKDTGPGAPFVFAGYIASMTATVLNSINAATNALSQARQPEMPDFGREERRSYFGGGFTGDDSLGFGDQYGDFAGYVHKKEYVVPEFVLQNRVGADIVGILEALRTGRQHAAAPSLATATPASSDNGNRELMQALLMETRELKQIMADKETIAKLILDQRDIKKLSEKIDLQKEIANETEF